MQLNLLLLSTAYSKNLNENEVYTVNTKCINSEPSIREISSYKQYKVSNHKGIKVLIPNNLNIPILLATQPIKLTRCINNIYQQADKIATIISIVVRANHRALQFSDFDSINFAQVSSTMMQHHVYDYSDYIDYLCENNILEKDNHYIKDEKCIGYRLTSTYKYALLTEYYISNYNGNNKKGASIYDSFFQVSKEQKVDIVKYKELYDDIKNVSVSNLDEVKNFIENELLPQITKSKLLDNHKIIEKQNSWISSLHDIQNNNLYFKQDKTSNRLHTSILGTKKELRQFLRLDNKRIISCDLKNSQPYISSFFFSFGEIKSEVWEIIKKCFNPIALHNRSLYLDILERIRNYKSGNILPSTKQYLHLVQNGELYEFMAVNLELIYNQKSNRKLVLTRKQGKESIFKLLFNPTKFSSVARDIFRSNFPEVASLFEDINTLFTHTKRESKRMGLERSNNILAITLQTLESHIILDVICKNLKDTYPNVPLLTLHDAIATNPEFEDLVKLEIETTFKEYINNKPTIQIEQW